MHIVNRRATIEKNKKNPQGHGANSVALKVKWNIKHPTVGRKQGDGAEETDGTHAKQFNGKTHLKPTMLMVTLNVMVYMPH